jgi:hypothetical protein
MDLAKQIRLNRLFSHPSQRLCSVAVDHFVGYQKGLPEGLVNLPETIRKLVEGRERRPSNSLAEILDRLHQPLGQGYFRPPL